MDETELSQEKRGKNGVAQISLTAATAATKRGENLARHFHGIFALLVWMQFRIIVENCRAIFHSFENVLFCILLCSRDELASATLFLTFCSM